ncbi:amidase [Aliisedimentitalea scapharcae]|uniref:Amidase n=1 Tax=Aliisedimentitalea scapharcae TaxID=1524259 RepID=A0ABZ2XP86_9RHOB
MSQPMRSATEILTDLSAGRLTAEDVMRQTLDRIAQVNGAVNAIVGLRDEEELMQEARAADKNAPRGPLHGLPMAVKDLVNVRGVRSTGGVLIKKDFVPTEDDLLAARLRAAGAILIGKTNVPEMGLGSHTFNRVYGATANPYDMSRSCGGSSGGAAVALATGMVALADGSDMMGSLRNPAAWNNVYGFRPSWGRVPSGASGDMYLHQLSTLGPMARSPEDIALLLDVLAGPHPQIPLALPREEMAPLPATECSGMRIGWLGDWGGAFPMENGIMALCERALGAFSDMGCHVDHLPAPFPREKIWESWVTLRSWAVAGELFDLQQQGAELKDTAVWEMERGMALTAAQIQIASEFRSEWFRACAQLFETYDALILPSAQVWPFPIEQPYPKQIAGQEMDTYHRWMEVVIPVSLLGLPSLAVPAGFGADGLPMGVQIFGRLGGDRRILSLGAAYHAHTQWPQKAPPTDPV